ncbi:MAG: TAXI family TRAP transporter solute-binding subunit [Pseudomonadota bacterium]
MATEKEATSQQDRTLPLASTFAILIAIAIIFASIYLYRQTVAAESHRDIVIAAGSPRGIYIEVGDLLKRMLDASDKFENVAVITTAGSVANLDLLSSHEVDLALVSSNVATQGDARMIADLYTQYLQILVSQDKSAGVETIKDLNGLRVAVGRYESGTRNLTLSILEHFQVEPAEIRSMSPGDSITALRAGEVDAAFFLSALSNQTIADLAASGEVDFLSIGSAKDGFSGRAQALGLLMPGVEHAIIPVGVYGRLPQQPIHTVSVEALLTARYDLPNPLVREITKTIFNARNQLNKLTGSSLIIARNLRENYEPAEAQIPYHEGAVSYYTREEPAFFVRNADAISLVLTVLAGIYSLFIAGRQYIRRTLKNRVDSYLVQVDRLSSGINGLTVPQLNSRRAALERLRREAFSDLVLERVLADSAFIILQNHLRGEVKELTMRIERNADRVSRRTRTYRNARD